MASERKVKLRVLRQDALDKPDTKHWEEFELEATAGMTVSDALEAIRRRPVDASGKAVSPVAWEHACGVEACGACTMNIQGRARHACSTFIEDIAPRGQTITLAPLARFPVERDLIVDRAKLDDGLKRVQAWVRLDGSRDVPAPAESQAVQRDRFALARCIGCGACLEACPELHEGSAFIGAAPIAQARLYDLHPVGALDRRARTRSLMGEGGVADCGKAQNCVEACPKGVPLIEALGTAARETTKEMIFGWLLG